MPASNVSNASTCHWQSSLGRRRVVFPSSLSYCLASLLPGCRERSMRGKPGKRETISYCKNPMNTPQSLAEPPLKNVSTKPPEPDRGSADTEKRFVPSA